MTQTSLLSYSDKEIDFNHLTRTENFTAYNKRGIPFTGSVSAQIIPYSDLVFSPIVQMKCVTCGMYGRVFGCGPKTAPYYVWQERLTKYNFFLLITGKIDVKPRIEDNLTLIKSEWRAKYYAGNEGVNILKKRARERRVETLNYLSVFGKVRTFSEGGGCRLAVLPETRISLYSGETKPARDIIVGDLLLGYDILKDRFISNKIKYIFERKSDYKIKITTESGKTLRVTPEHPVYTKQGWKKAIDIKEGDEVISFGDSTDF